MYNVILEYSDLRLDFSRITVNDLHTEIINKREVKSKVEQPIIQNSPNKNQSMPIENPFNHRFRQLYVQTGSCRPPERLIISNCYFLKTSTISLPDKLESFLFNYSQKHMVQAFRVE